MSWAQKMQEKVEEENKPVQTKDISEDEIQEIPVKEPMFLLMHTIDKAKEFCQELRQDWVVFITGGEGSGKSTLASHVCKRFDPNYSIDESMIYSFRDQEHSFLRFMQRFKDTPHKVAWYDEAVTVLFSHRHSSKDSADAQEIFKIKRDCRHYDVLVSPSFWDVVPDIRERRTKSLLYCFTEVYHPIKGKTCYRHCYAYFGGNKIIKLSENSKAKIAFRSYRELFKIVKPDFIEEFPDMDESVKAEYMAAKRENRNAVLDRINGIETADGSDKLLIPENFDLTELRAELYKLNPAAFETEAV